MTLTHGVWQSREECGKDLTHRTLLQYPRTRLKSVIHWNSGTHYGKSKIPYGLQIQNKRDFTSHSTPWLLPSDILRHIEILVCHCDKEPVARNTPEAPNYTVIRPEGRPHEDPLPGRHRSTFRSFGPVSAEGEYDDRCGVRRRGVRLFWNCFVFCVTLIKILIKYRWKGLSLVKGHMESDVLSRPSSSSCQQRIWYNPDHLFPVSGPLGLQSMFYHSIPRVDPNPFVKKKGPL